MKYKHTHEKPQPVLWAFMAIILCLVCMLVAGLFYVTSVRGALMDQAVASMLSMTQQQQQAFSNFVTLDRERMHSFAINFAHDASTDGETIEDKLSAFDRVEAIYTVIDLEHGVYYSNYTDGALPLSDESLREYASFSGSGMRRPYQGLVDDDLMFGYYECFTFQDGARGVFQKGYSSKRISDEFSLSFYNDKGFAFITDANGEILLRSTDSINGYNFDNVLDLISADESASEQETNRARLTDILQKRMIGTELFDAGGTNYAYAYVPVSAFNEWYFVSIVPYSAILGEANGVISNSRIISLIFLLMLIILLIVTFSVHRTSQNTKKKDQAAHYHEQRFNTLATFLARNTDDVYIMMDRSNHSVEFISPNIMRVLGIAEEDAMCDICVLGDVSYINGAAPTFNEIDSLIAGSTIGPFDTERVNPQTGLSCWFRETVYAVTIQNQEKIVAYISDRTAEREAQEALSVALESARVANESKSSFLSSMSHDIRTPLNAIIGLIVLLQQDANDPSRVTEYAERMSSASHHLLALINDILDMNKIESGNITLNIGDFNVSEIIDEIVSIIRPQAKTKQQDFKILIAELPHERLCGDKMRINQVLINLLSNAVKYTQPGGSVEMEVREMPQILSRYSHIRFTVRDNGMGMSEEYQKVIFDPFTREKDTMINQIQGTGLGMAITKSLVDLMGGTIEVQSAKGEGSVFTVELDLRIQDEADDIAFWEKYDIHRMIVVDNEEDTCRHVVCSMTDTGVEVYYETDGKNALATIRAARKSGNAFDIILLDWKMPNMSGLETARLIRQNYSEKVPIFIFTAHDWEDIEEEATQVGIDHFIPKPFFLSNFKRAVRKVMNERNKAGAAGATQDISAAKGKHFLVVEDIDVNRLILTKILTNCGATCDSAENGKEGYERFEHSAPGTYDMILMDVQMPLMNGYEATRAIRASKHPDAKRIPIVAMTANAFADDVRDALDSGMDAHVAKPIVLEQLEAAMRKVFEDRAAQEDAGGA